MYFNTLPLDIDPGVELAYTDSGAPHIFPYTTIFAVHGICFTNRTLRLLSSKSYYYDLNDSFLVVFKKLQSTALTKGFRFVAINRRPYAGSTLFTQDEINLIISDDVLADKRAAFLEARGHELASFIDTFTCRFGLPPISDDGKTGGSVVYGWSMGAQLSVVMLGSIPTLPLAVRSRLVSQFRSLVIYGVQDDLHAVK